MTPATPTGGDLRDALLAEWAKATTAPGLWALLAATSLSTAALGVVAVAATQHRPGVSRDLVETSLTGVHAGQALVAVLAVLAICGEYRDGMIIVTLSAMPRRLTMLAAKAIVVVGLVVPAATVGLLGSLLAGRLILPGNGFTRAHGHPPLSLMDAPTLRAAFGTVLYLALVALLSLGVATAVRDAACATASVLGLLYLFPIVAAVVADPNLERQVQRLAPADAGLSIQATTDLASLPIGPWPGLGVLAAWTTAALACGGLALCRRDA